MQQDIVTGAWRTQLYPVADHAAGRAAEWFRLSSLIEVLEATETRPSPSVATSADAQSERMSEALPAKVSGDEAVKLAGKIGADHVWLGRRGGLHGPLAQGDVASGAWMTHMYPVMTGRGRKNRDWFHVEELLRAVGETDSSV